jgi:alpha-L-fucosidase 2
MGLGEPSERFLEQHDLVWEVPPERWLEGIPLGNGDIGALVWGDGAPLKVTLDKYDAWERREKSYGDTTYEGLRQLIRDGKRKEAEELLYVFRVYAEGPHPTRLPLPRLEMDFGGPFEWDEGRLRLRSAAVDLNGEVDGEPVRVEALVHANQNVLVMRLTGAGAGRASVKVGWDNLSEDAKAKLREWGYPDPCVTSDATSGTWHLKAPSGYELAVAWGLTLSEDDGSHLLCVALCSTADAEDPLRAAQKQCRNVTGFSECLRSHRAWWGEYWQRSWLTIPDARLEALYYAEMYKLGCSSRPGKMPISLQGVWTLDGDMPPWSGEYALNMNIQQSYWPIYTANRLELGEPFYRMFSACLPRWQEQCRQFFGFEGVWSGCCLGPAGERLYGYSGIEVWQGNTAWLAHHYWLHYLYSQDEAFLRDEALPFMELSFLGYANLLEPDEAGVLHVPLGNSPEWGEGSFEAYCRDANCDLALIRFLARAIVESYELLGGTASVVERAREVLDTLTDYPREDNHLMISADGPLSHSHRHHSHLMAIHPLATITMDGSEDERDLIRGSLHDIRKKGPGQWTGWSYPWMSLIASRAGYGNMAWQMLDLYANGFISSNTFHVNGDPRVFGLSLFEYEPMTLEAGFGAAAATMEMLLQSWNGCIRLFPTIPDRWHDAYFANLRAEGAFVVTASLQDGAVVFVQIHSAAGRPCRIHNPFGDGAAEVACLVSDSHEAENASFALSGEILNFDTEAGAEYIVYPQGKRPDPADMGPPEFSRGNLDRNHYGSKRLKRF